MKFLFFWVHLIELDLITIYKKWIQIVWKTCQFFFFLNFKLFANYTKLYKTVFDPVMQLGWVIPFNLKSVCWSSKGFANFFFLICNYLTIIPNRIKWFSITWNIFIFASNMKIRTCNFWNFTCRFLIIIF